MKRAIALLSAALLTLSLAACGNSGSNTIGVINSGGASGGTAAPEEKTTGEITGEIAGEITVSCFETATHKNFLEDAAQKFQDKYPGTTVNVESFSKMPEVKTQEENGKTTKMMMKGDDTQEKNDYINKINTELMGGKGADVLAMDVIPFHKYAEDGLLENLRDYMESDEEFNIGDYRANILNTLTTDGKQYIFPLDYSFTYFAYDSTLLGEQEQVALDGMEKISFEEIIEIGAEAFETVNENAAEPTTMFALTDGTRQKPNMFSELFDENYSSFVDIAGKEANFTDGGFESLLNSVKEYSEAGYLKQVGGGERKMTPDMFQENLSERYFFKPKGSGSLISEFNKNSGIKRMTTMAGNEEDDKISGLLTNDRGETPFKLQQAYGINSNSQNKRTAWEFIKFLSEQEMQESMELFGIPININGFLERSKMEITGELYLPERAGAELDEEGKTILDSYVAAVEKYTGMLNTFYVKDETINGIVEAEAANFFEGNRTASEVAEVIQNKVSLYLNE